MLHQQRKQSADKCDEAVSLLKFPILDARDKCREVIHRPIFLSACHPRLTLRLIGEGHQSTLLYGSKQPIR
jgi:hypothetical protein